MKKILLSTLCTLTIGTLNVNAGDIKLYTDSNGQVFTTNAENRMELKNSNTLVQAKTSKLNFSGTHYIGYNHKSVDTSDTTGTFEFRRNYLQVKAYLLEDPKSYLRITLDATYTNSKADDIRDEVDDHADVYVKYAYLYLDNILPFTGVEFGMAHRPWIDYEEHQGWWMRSISKVFVEASESAHLTNSADLGINFKTKTPYFTSEIGLFNGEGYHGANSDDSDIGDGNSAEWRFTVAALGNGKKKRKSTKDSYLDASFFGQYNMDSAKNKGETYAIYGAHAVYNMSNFLLAAQYVKAENDLKTTSQFNGDGYSINATGRMGENKEYSVIARYDEWNSKNQDTMLEQSTNNAIYGIAWQQNKNVKWLFSGQTFEAKDGRNYKGSSINDWNSVMLTTEVHW